MNEFNLPNYSILRKIGEGGMGTVYLAIDSFLHRQVAIKVLKPGISSRKDVMLRFQTEAVTLAKLKHPNITMLYNLVQENNNWCMIMEYIDGETLDARLKKMEFFHMKKQ